MKKKVLSILLSTAMILSLCGCGDGKVEETTEPTETTEGTSVVDEAEKLVAEEEEYNKGTLEEIAEDIMDEYSEPEEIYATKFDEIPEEVMSKIIADIEEELINDMEIEAKLVKAMLLEPQENNFYDNNIRFFYEVIKENERHQGKYCSNTYGFEIKSDGTIGRHSTGTVLKMFADEEELQEEYNKYENKVDGYSCIDEKTYE